MGFFKNMFNSMPFDEAIEKTSFFLRPQIAVIEETYGSHRYAVITWESVAYTVSIASYIAERPIKVEEAPILLISVFGESYKKRFEHLGKIVDMSSFLHSMQDVKEQAKQDVMNGIFRSSNFLVHNAKAIYDELNDMKRAYERSNF